MAFVGHGTIRLLPLHPRLLLTMLVGAPMTAGQAQQLTPGMVITRSIKIAPRVYRLPSTSLDSAAITIRGDNVTVDLTGVTLLGTDSTADPDQAKGLAIHVDGGRNVRVIGARLRGYKIGLLATGTRNLVLQNIDAGYNWKPRLYSLVEHESLADWLSFHQNEKREWFRYGAGIYLEDVKGGEVRASQVTQGMNGLLLVRSDSLLIRDNDFWYNSGLGIGLYRSSDNTIVRNRLDYNVRGYSDAFYHRGQDSADLLLYEQSSRNIVAWNSATHGGDGVFLWAGQSTMDTGQGGANDNVFFANDFSFAPANAIEATFSRNKFIANRAVGSDYGVWAGYSWESVIAGNCFVANRTGIAIEHGQDNTIVANRFDRDTTAIWLWANPIEPSDWGYPKHRDTRSKGYRITGNAFLSNRAALRVKHTDSLELQQNRLGGVDSALVADDSSRTRMSGTLTSSGSPAIPCGPGAPLPLEVVHSIPSFPGVPREIPASFAAGMDRSAIVVDDWGPFDWGSPKLWPMDSARANPLRLRTGGPPGTWKVVEQTGIASLSSPQGRIGDTVTVHPAGNGHHWNLVLEYRGQTTVSPRGKRRAAGIPYRFDYGRWEPELRWDARFFSWKDSTEIRKDVAFKTLLFQRPMPRLDFQWYRPRIQELPLEHWGLDATTTVTLPLGSYQLRTISDDGIQVWIDGRLVIDNWSVHESVIDTAALTGGRHDLRVRYFQDNGWTELRVEILRGP